MTFTNSGYKCLNVDSGNSFDTPCASVTLANLPLGAETVEIREINISLAGEADNDSTVEKTLTAIINNAFDEGVLVLKAGKITLRFLPPLTITKEEIDEGFKRLENAISKI